MIELHNVKGPFVVSKEFIPAPCLTCGLLLTPDIEVYHSISWVRGQRARLGGRGGAFCSPECRTTWWCSATTTPFADVQRPDTVEVIDCPDHIDGNECGRCYGTLRHVLTTDFFYSDPSLPEWKDGWECHDPHFDRNIALAVFDCATRDQAVIGVDSRGFVASPGHVLVEMWQFPDPLSLNDWWQESIARDDHDRLREKLRAHYTRSQARRAEIELQARRSAIA